MSLNVRKRSWLDSPASAEPMSNEGEEKGEFSLSRPLDLPVTSTPNYVKLLVLTVPNSKKMPHFSS